MDSIPSPPSAAPGPAPTAGTLLHRTFAVWTRGFVPYTGVVLLLQAPVIGAGYLLPSGGRPSSMATMLLGMAGGILGLVATGAISHGVIHSLAGKPVRFLDMLGTGFARIGTILLTSLLVGLAVGVGLLLLVIPGLVAVSALWVAVPAAVAEPEGGGFERSLALTRGHRLTLLLVLGVLYAVFFAVAFAAALADPYLLPGRAEGLLVELLGTVASGALAVGPAVAYHDLRCAKEGTSTEELAALFE